MKYILLSIALVSNCFAIDRPTKIMGANGKSIEVLKKQYMAKPIYTEEYFSNKAVGELRTTVKSKFGHLQNYKIKEIWWSEGDNRHTYFCHLVDGKWIVFDTLSWNKDIRF